MSLLLEHPNSADLGDRIREAGSVTAEFLFTIIGATCRRFPATRPNARTARVERLIQSGAWTDAALSLIDLELPQWQVRRLAYDDGEWHCALSRLRELPEWLDTPIETHHADLALAILGAFVEALQSELRARYPDFALPDATTDYTRIINDAQYARLHGYVEDARARGVVVVEPLTAMLDAAGRTRLRHERLFPPTLVVEPPAASEVMRGAGAPAAR